MCSSTKWQELRSISPAAAVCCLPLVVRPLTSPCAQAGQAEFCVAQGNDVALLQGTTGEWPSLTVQERLDLAAEWRRCIPKGHKMKLILHVGHDSIADAKALARAAAELDYDAVLVSPPSKFVAPSLEAQVACLAEMLAPCPETPAFYYHYPIVYRDEFDLIELFDAAAESCPTLCGCKLSGTPVEEVIRLGTELDPAKYGVITTGNTNLLSSIELPAIRGAIVYCHEVPLYTPVFEAMEAGDRARAEVRPRPLAPPPLQTLRLTRRPGPADPA